MPLPRPRGSSNPEKRAAALEEARYAELAEIRESPLRPSHIDDLRAHYLDSARSLRSRAHNRPAMSPRQVFVLGDAELLVPQRSSPEAANALLKLLEEPPADTHFILTSSEPGRLLTTIRSRALPLHLPRLSGGQVEGFLVEEAEADPDEAARAASLAGGSIGRALGFLPVGDGPGPLEALRQTGGRILSAALSPRRGKGFELALSFGVAGARGLVDQLDFVELWIRDLAAAATGASGSLVNADARGALERWARTLELDPVAVARALEAVEAARGQARGNVNPQLLMTGLMSRLRTELLSGRGEPEARAGTVGGRS
jgi:DNA polymerase-3 subunit delta'